MRILHPLPITFYRSVLCFLIVVFASNTSSGQAVTRIYTDFNNYYVSGVGALSATVPNRSHSLLAFTYNGVTYTTGVKDSALAANNITRVQGNYQSLPASSIGGTVAASTYILTPAADDGVPAGTVQPYPALRIIDVLTDGLKGLNIGSGVTNLPKTSSLTFPVSGIDVSSIGDTKPDIMYTQIAATSAGDPPDTVFFVNNVNAMVGNTILVSWASIGIVGSHSCDLYTLSAGSCDIATVNGVNSSSQPKDFRLTAFRLSEFGINTGNAGSISQLIIKPGGTSDMAFVAYNVDAFTVLSTVPVIFTGVSASFINDGIEVRWQTGSETGNDHFVVERSTDGETFHSIGTVAGAGNSSQSRDYSITDNTYPPGTIYYRIRQVDIDGRSETSKIVTLSAPSERVQLILQPNPASGSVLVKHVRAAGTEKIAIVNSAGAEVKRVKVSGASIQTSINLQQLPAGIYQVIWINGKDRVSTALMVR